MFTIKAVSQATGVSIETLRAWERRYRVVVPARDPNGRRSYAPEDVIRLRKLHEATERGHAISKLARFSDEELAAVLAAPGKEGPPQLASRSFANQMVVAAENYRPEDCEQALSMALALLPLGDVVRNVLTPVLLDIGERWHSGTFNVAQERIVTGTVRRQVGAVLDTYNRITSSSPIVFATLTEERHELGILMAALIAASRGARCHYLGPDVPAADIAIYARRVAAAVVVLSVPLRASLALANAGVAELAQSLPRPIGLWIGGSAVPQLELGPFLERITVLADFDAFERALDTLAIPKR
jgi:DNA-binding transcriptional MerR regulator/methylmalonyl-CoA mutase cobalamin-binding subunit